MHIERDWTGSGKLDITQNLNLAAPSLPLPWGELERGVIFCQITSSLITQHYLHLICTWTHAYMMNKMNRLYPLLW